MRLDISSHNIKVSQICQRGREALIQFCKPLIQMGLERVGRQYTMVPKRTFAAAMKDRSEFRFHVNQLEDLKQHLGHFGFKGDTLTIVEHKTSAAAFPQVEHIIKEMFEPREQQVPIIEYVQEDGTIKMITLQTGKGKTYIAMRTAWLMGLRTCFIFKGMYVERWMQDLEKTFEFEDDELLMVRGSGGLIKLMQMAISGVLKAKMIVITNKTMYNYIKDYETTNGKSKLYPIPPHEFYERTGIGYRVMDEVHLDFHLNYRQDLYTHTYKSLSLSATMVSSDQFMNRMYDIAYPIHKRNDGGGYHKYIAVTAILYRMTRPDIIRCKGGTGGYSHNAFEESLMSKKLMFANYLKMIEHIVMQKFIKRREDGQKMLIFFASVKLCTLVAERLQKIHPSLKVARYCQGDEYSDLLDADIGVSTILSAGTAVDIRNLRITLMTTSIDSRQSNEQALGRTRELADFPGITPEFLYLVNTDNDRHMAYHANKQAFFRLKALSQAVAEISFLM